MKSFLKLDSDSIWQADLISVFVLVAFVGAVYLLDNYFNPVLTSISLLFAGIVLALIPALVWIAFFYRRDRLNPEPKTMIFQVFVLGGLLAAAIGIPMLRNVFEISSWINRSIVTQLIGAILVIGFTQEFLKFAAVRFSVFGSKEFDEPIDGIIYATAAGLGYATVLNIVFVVESGGVDLGAGVIRITVTSLAHASFAGVVGYFLGIEKCSEKPAWWTAAGISLAALLNGLFFYLRTTLTRGSISTSGGYVQQWLGMVLAAALAVSVTALLSNAIRKQAKQNAPVEEV